MENQHFEHARQLALAQAENMIDHAAACDRAGRHDLARQAHDAFEFWYAVAIAARLGSKFRASPVSSVCMTRQAAAEGR